MLARTCCGPLGLCAPIDHPAWQAVCFSIHELCDEAPADTRGGGSSHVGAGVGGESRGEAQAHGCAITFLMQSEHLVSASIEI